MKNVSMATHTTELQMPKVWASRAEAFVGKVRLPKYI